MSYSPIDPYSGITPIADIDTTQQLLLGAIRKFGDNTLGEGEFIYLPGVSGNFVGAAITYDLGLGTVSLMTSSSPANSALAVSMAANTNTSYWNWYQVTGVVAVYGSGTIAEGDLVYTTATGGELSTNSGGNLIGNAHWTSANGAAPNGLTYAMINPR